MVCRALELTDWIWEEHDRLEVVITPKYLNELTCLSWEPFKKRRERGSLEKKETYDHVFVFLELIARWRELICDVMRLMLNWTMDIEVRVKTSWERRMLSA